MSCSDLRNPCKVLCIQLHLFCPTHLLPSRWTRQGARFLSWCLKWCFQINSSLERELNSSWKQVSYTFYFVLHIPWSCEVILNEWCFLGCQEVLNWKSTEVHCCCEELGYNLSTNSLDFSQENILCVLEIVFYRLFHSLLQLPNKSPWSGPLTRGWDQEKGKP